MDQIIVKVQVPLATNAPRPMALVYSKDRETIHAYAPITQELLEAMDGEFKSFFYARLEGDVVCLESQAPWQEW